MFLPWAIEIFRTAIVFIMQTFFWICIFYICCRIGAKAIARSILEEISNKPTE